MFNLKHTTICLILAIAGNHALAQTDAAFLEAKQAFARADSNALASTQRKLDGSVLQIYPQYWQLSLAIGRAQIANGELVPAAMQTQVESFLSQHGESPLAEQLRKDWLKLLAKSGNWGAYRNAASFVLSEDADITCYNLQERLQRQDTSALSEAKGLWLADKEAPSSCSAAFDALVRASQLSYEEVFSRIRNSLAANQVRDALRAGQYLPTGYTLNEANIDRAQREPLKYLQKVGVDGKKRGSVEVALLALNRIAKQDAADAVPALALLKSLNDADRAFAWAMIGAYGAQQHLSQADEWVKQGFANGPVTLPESLGTWAVRAALRAEDWSLVVATVRALPEATRMSDNAWRYWLARGLSAQGKKDEAQALYRELSSELGFYGWMARDEVSQQQAAPVGTSSQTTTVAPVVSAPASFRLDWQTPKASAADLQRVRGTIGLQRSMALYRLGQRDEGFREWMWALRFVGKPSVTEPGKKLPPADSDYVAAAEIALAENIPDRAIGTALRTTSHHDFRLRFPTHHLDSVKAHAQRTQLEPSFIYGIIRQESRFMADVRSRAGAVGLMQLMPSTAKWVAGKMQMPSHKTADLTNTDINIAMGSFYLKSVFDDLGDRVMATAAYNAGPGRAKRWRDERALEGAIYAETIPFNETRDYVKQVMVNMAYYESRLSGTKISMKQLVGLVPGRNKEAGSSTAAPDPAGVSGVR